MTFETLESPRPDFVADIGMAASIQPSSRPKLLSFFCGAGGLDLGFTQAGFDIALAADYNSAAVDTHNANSTTRSAVKLDLSEASASEITKIVLSKDATAAPIGIIGGPPCQGFSRANTKRSNLDPRNNMAVHYANTINDLTQKFPIKFFVLENVPEILAKKNNDFLNELFKNFERSFRLFKTCLNAADFGVPQKRIRYFIVGIRKDVAESTGEYNFPKPEFGEYTTVRNAIANLPEPRFFERNLNSQEIPLHPNHWTMQPRSKRFSPELVSSGRSMIRLSWDKPSRTVAYGNREIHVHPSGLRRISIYEAMLLQGFPENFELKGNFSEQVTQISNAVPPPVSLAIAKSIKNFLGV